MTSMLSAEEVKARIEGAVSGCRVEVVANGSPSEQHSLRIDREHALRVALFLRDDTELRLDYCSNVSGVDWLDSELSEKVKMRKLVKASDGTETEQDMEETRKTRVPGYLEAVYHLFSMEKKHGPVVLRMRTANRSDDTWLRSLTPVWRSAEFQEREIFDLYGVVFEGHPDLRRILMWDGFKDHPMRRDYVPPAEDDLVAAAE
jgi:NADH-quinone oxidoreductase subunit C